MKSIVFTMLSLCLVVISIACTSLDTDQAATPTPLATATPHPAPSRAIVTAIDTTSSQTLAQVTYNLEHSLQVMRQVAAAGDHFIGTWLNTRVFSTDQTFAEIRFPDPAVLQPCLPPVDSSNPFDPPPEADEYKRCVADNAARQEQVEAEMQAARALLVAPALPALDQAGTPVFDALIKANELLQSFPPATKKVLLVYSDMQNNWGGQVTLRLDGVHMIVILAIQDASLYQQAQAQWTEVLNQAGAASIEFFYPGAPATNVAAVIPVTN